MSSGLVQSHGATDPRRARNLPAIIGRAGRSRRLALHRILTASIRTETRAAAYAHAVAQFFAWCESHRIHTLEQIHPVHDRRYIEQHPAAAPTVKQHLAAIRVLFDFLVIGQIVPMNPAALLCAGRSMYVAARENTGPASRQAPDAA